MLKTPDEPPSSFPVHYGRSQPSTAESTSPELDELTDGRPLWDWPTRYPALAWVIITSEALYLVASLVVGLVALYKLGDAFSSAEASNGASGSWFAGVPKDILIWASVALGGLCGGSAFALKWLYHGVAHGKWHCDRLVWRIVVPILSGVLALFTALMVGSGIIPIFSSTIFDAPTVGAAFGFFVGFFSDNLIATLQRLANQLLGTLEPYVERKHPTKDK